MQLLFNIGFIAIGCLVAVYVFLCVALVTSMWFPPINTRIQICTFYTGGSSCLGGK